MRYRLQGSEHIGLRQLALVVPADLRVMPHRKVGGFHKGPRKYVFPFLVLPFRFPLLSLVLLTHRQYDANCPTVGNRRISPVSNMRRLYLLFTILESTRIV